MISADMFRNADGYKIKNLWSGEVTENRTGIFSVNRLNAYESITVRVTPL